jgi:hypothetical protein
MVNDRQHAEAANEFAQQAHSNSILVHLVWLSFSC